MRFQLIQQSVRIRTARTGSQVRPPSFIRLEIAPEVVLNRKALGRSSELQGGERQRTCKICKARLYIKKLSLFYVD